MQDRAPPHYAKVVREFLETSFGEENVISRGCKRSWPPRSPDLSPVDFWFWGTLKARVFHYQQTRTLEELQSRIEEECARFTLEELNKAVSSFSKRVDLILSVGGKHFENVL